MTERKPRRLKCRHCGELVSRKSKNKYFCSVKCMKAAVKENNLPENKERIEAEREGKPLRFARVPKKDRPLLPDELEVSIDPSLTTHLPGNPDKLVFKKDDWDKLTNAIADEHPMFDAVKIPYERSLTGETKHDMMQDLFDFGRCASITDENGIRRLDPMSDEVLTIMANAAAKGSSHTEIYDPEEVKRIWEEAKADGRVQEPTEPSPWQGDAPEGTVAHKLKYGEFYKKDLK